ncbi:MAG TPA: bifunctional alpha/beta hydrolase/class I SAM-dependent methyltransferase [Thermoanaerobaculia bacterium]|jgi:alpha-beta hydrolase superfamily lysophospholipase|nr:bifunctional alpha/beta hydrolase/class I SAM-dependent methyltransferase [Thermoanaerobaculia bacterium]
MQELHAPVNDVQLFYRAWTNPGAKKAVVLVHRGHEHSGRLADVVENLGITDAAFFAWDARGHGRSPGDRGYAPSFSQIVKDLDAFVRHVSRTHGIAVEDMVVLGHSVGAVTVAAWVHDFAPPIRAMVLVTPALKVKLYVPFARTGLALLQAMRGDRKSYVQSYVKSTMLTHDAAEAKRYAEDPLITRAISVNVLLDLYEISERIVADAGAIRVPALVLSGGADWVVDVKEQRKFFDRLGSQMKRMRVFDGMYHDLLHEAGRAEVLAEIREFINESHETREPLLHADRDGYTKREYDQLTRPASPLKSAAFAVQRITLSTIGKLSRGVRLGWESGFDSGRSLDYVYENEARGKLGIGKLIDRAYLGSVGWKGIRQRKLNLEKLLRTAIAKTQDNLHSGDVRILDVATGCGRYVLDVLKDEKNATALLRDFTPANVEQGREIARSMGLSDRVTFEQGNAFDEEALAKITPAPTIAIVSGLYELFGDNEMVLRSLRGISRGMTEGGYLVYTGQPWHPQLEMIARVLTNRDGKPWIMRRRTQEEMDDLVRAAGFRKIDMEIDRWGIFTVSLSKI